MHINPQTPLKWTNFSKKKKKLTEGIVNLNTILLENLSYVAVPKHKSAP
jgi:hypothetical protein